MRRRLLVVLLALGTVGGYASGFASVARHRYRCHASSSWGERWENRGEHRWDSRGPRESWEPRGYRGSAPPPAEAPIPPASPASAEGPR
ncbi:hypothetical protein [Pyxidicoccus trucidator]|uniref:hypothetical protein n=1 Tax=Pyxidicoccus trucidator TaxID=2709662 RepID=UPI0013D9FB64|nr:hypothetical protein [Pyxidicoccus trucidator]